MMIGNIIDDKEVQEQVGYEKYDIVTANILADVLVPLTPVIVAQMKKGAYYITSGILDVKEDVVVKAVKDAGLTLVEVTHQGEWVSVTARKGLISCSDFLWNLIRSTRDRHEIHITGSDVNHIVNVLRMKKGEELWISDKGKEYHCVIENAGEDEVLLHILYVQDRIYELKTAFIFFRACRKRIRWS